MLVTLASGAEKRWRQVARDIGDLVGLRLAGSWFMASIGEQCLIFDLPSGNDAARAARSIASVPSVAVVQPTQLFRVLAEDAADPYLHLQSAAAAVHVAAAHRLATGKGIRVAVIDTGVDFEHPDLRQRIARAENFVERGERTFTRDAHGTAVAGVLAAQAGNGVGIAGVAPAAELMALKACWPDPPGSRQALCDTYTLARALDVAITGGARIVNLSLAGPFDALLALQIDAALTRRIVVVAAAEGVPAGFPASRPGVLAVRSVDLTRPEAAAEAIADARPEVSDGAAAARSSQGGAAVASELAAPGVDVLSTAPAATYDFFTGSSFAAAQVSGVAALILERRPELGPEEIARLLATSARPLPNLTLPGSEAPPLLLDACAALAAALGQPDC